MPSEIKLTPPTPLRPREVTVRFSEDEYNLVLAAKAKVGERHTAAMVRNLSLAALELVDS